MKVLNVLFVISGCWAQVPSIPQGGLSIPQSGLPAGIPTGPPTGVPTGPPAAVPTGLPVKAPGGQGGTPNPLEINPNLTGPPANVNRPCRRFDLNCIRYFFKDHSKCKAPAGKVPDPLLRPISNVLLPAFNLTSTNINGYYSGFNKGRVQDLYVNRETDKVVLTVLFTNLTFSCKDVFLRYHRRAREPIITYGYVAYTYESLLLTVTIPQVDNLLLAKSDNFGYSNTVPLVDLDPRLSQSSDPMVETTFAALVSNLPTATTELLLTESSYIASVFIQNVICDFGLKIV